MAFSNNLQIPLPEPLDKVSRINLLAILNAIDENALNKNKVLTDVPEGAVFTDTVYVHPGEGTNPHGTTKEDVGLKNVDDVKQMPISGGVLEDYSEKLVVLSSTEGASTIALSAGNVFSHTLTEDTTYAITDAVSGSAHSFTLIITQPAVPVTVTFPESVRWQDAQAPNVNTGDKIYVLAFLSIDGGATWLGMFGGEF